MVQNLNTNRSYSRHKLDTKLLKLQEDFHDASKKRYEDARRDVEELKRNMDTEARTIEEEFEREFPVNKVAEELLEDNEITHSSNGLQKVDERAQDHATHEECNSVNGEKGLATSQNEIRIHTLCDEAIAIAEHFDTSAKPVITAECREEGSINDFEAIAGIFAPFTPTSEFDSQLIAKRRHKHTGSSSSLSSAPSDLDSPSSTPSKARNRKQRKSFGGVALKIGSRTTRHSKPENNGRAGHDETIGFSWVVSMIGWDPARDTSELPVTWRREISLKMTQPDFNSFKPYRGVEDRGKLFPKMILDHKWNGIAFYDVPSLRFEIFKKNGERLRIQFVDTKYWVFGENKRIGAQEVPSFMTAFKAELGSKIAVEQSSNLGGDSDFLKEGAGSHPAHLVRLQEL